MFALDTNALVVWQKQHPTFSGHYNAAMRRGEAITIPSLVRFEARRELANPLYQRRLTRLDNLFAGHATLDLDAASVDIAVKLFDALRSHGKLIDDADLLIAAAVLCHDGVLVTHNTAHFERIPGLKITDWQEENPQIKVGGRGG